jgi:hypothetical protein
VGKGQSLRALWISLAAVLGAAAVALVLFLTGVIPVAGGGSQENNELWERVSSSNYLEVLDSGGVVTGEIVVRGEADEAAWGVMTDAVYDGGEMAAAADALDGPVELSVRQNDGGAKISIPEKLIEPGMPYTVTLAAGVHFTADKLKNARAVTFIADREDVETIVYKDNVVELTVNEAQVTGDGVLKIDSQRDVGEGDILVVPVKNDTGVTQQTAFRVKSVESDGSVTTEEPALEEIFEELEISGTYEIDPDDFVMDEAAVEKQVRESALFESLVRTVHAADDDEITIKVERLPNAGKTLNFRVKIQWGNGFTVVLDLGLKVTVDVDVVKTLVYDISCNTLTTVDVSLGYGDDAKKSDKLPEGMTKEDYEEIEEDLRSEGNSIFRLGYIPIPFPGPASLTLGVDAFASFELVGDLDLSSGLAYGYKMGVIVGPGKFKPYSSREVSMDIDRAIGKVKLSGKAGLKASVTVSVLKVAEAGFEAEGGPYLEGAFAAAFMSNEETRLDDHIYGYIEGGLYYEISAVAKLNLLVKKYKYEVDLTPENNKWKWLYFGKTKYISGMTAESGEISIVGGTAQLPTIRLEYFNVTENRDEEGESDALDLTFECPEGITCTADENGALTFSGTLPDSFTLIVGHKETDKTVELKCSKAAEAAGAGNTPGNLANGGIAAASGGWIYYCGRDGGIHSMHEDGSDDTLLSNDNARYLNIVGEWIYYIRVTDTGGSTSIGGYGDIYRMRTDGTSNELVEPGNCSFLTVLDGWLYYLSGGQIVKMRMDGTQKETLPVEDRESVQSFSVADDTIAYYSLTDTEEDGYPIQLVQLKRMNLDGSDVMRIDGTTYGNGRGDWFDYVQLYEGDLYSTFGGGPDISVRKNELSGEGTSDLDPLSSEVYTALNVDGGRFYVATSDYQSDTSMLASAGMDGGSRKVLRIADEADVFYGVICIAGHWLFFMDYDGLQIIDINAESVEETGQYLIPGSDSRYITEADLAGFDAETARRARNEIFARYGYTFEDNALQTFFDRQGWYESDPGCNKSHPPKLNPYEEYNVDIIKNYEEQFATGVNDSIAGTAGTIIVTLVDDAGDGEYTEAGVIVVDGGYLVRCNIEQVATLSYTEYNRLADGETLDIKGAGRLKMTDTLRFADSEADEAEYYIMEKPTASKPAEIYSIWLVDPISYTTGESKQYFVSDSTAVRTITYQDGNWYEDVPFGEYSLMPYRYYAKVDGDSIEVFEEIYEP